MTWKGDLAGFISPLSSLPQDRGASIEGEYCRISLQRLGKQASASRTAATSGRRAEEEAKEAMPLQ
jgi:hypothetical protein